MKLLLFLFFNILFVVTKTAFAYHNLKHTNNTNKGRLKRNDENYSSDEPTEKINDDYNEKFGLFDDINNAISEVNANESEYEDTVTENYIEECKNINYLLNKDESYNCCEAWWSVTCINNHITEL